MREPLGRVLDARQRVAGDPPERGVGLGVTLEPGAPAAQHGKVRRVAEGEGLERVDGLPDGQVDDHVRVRERADRRGVAAFALQPPDEPGRGVRPRVDRLQRLDERGEPRVVEGGEQTGDVDLREPMPAHSP